MNYLQAVGHFQADGRIIHYEVTYQRNRQSHFPTPGPGLYVRFDVENICITEELSTMLYEIATPLGFLTHETTQSWRCWAFKEPLDCKNPSEALRGIWDGLRKLYDAFEEPRLNEYLRGRKKGPRRPLGKLKDTFDGAVGIRTERSQMLPPDD